MSHLRVAALQYFIRPVQSFDQFREQIEGLVETAHDYECHLVVFPEYFCTQLLTLGDIRRPMPEQIRSLSDQSARIDELFVALASKTGMYIVGGTLPVLGERGDMVFNQSTVYGACGRQRKLHMTRFEAEEWNIAPGHRLRVFDTAFGRMAINVCYDVEFPELARAAARAGATVLVVPSCTDDRQGYFRVRYCAQARAIENQMYIVLACTVGSLPTVPAVALNYGQAAILTPSDFPFARDGIRAEGIPNQESMVISELDVAALVDSRDTGTVLPLRDSQSTAAVTADLEFITI